MKLDKIIFAIDDNPEYSGFWEINSEKWTQMQITNYNTMTLYFMA